MTAHGHEADALVQPIVLLRCDSHEMAIAAAATASVYAYLSLPENDPLWQEWLSSRYTKTVRRARQSQFDRIRDDDSLPSITATVDVAQATAFRPMRYRDMPRDIARLQVSGTDFPRTGWGALTDAVFIGGPVLVINDSLDMTTGKAAAQASHALFQWILSLPRPAQQDWADAGAPFTLTGTGDQFSDVAARADLTVTDAGFTEIDSGSVTVAIYTPEHATIMAPAA